MLWVSSSLSASSGIKTYHHNIHEPHLAILMIHLHHHVSSTLGHSCPMTRIKTSSKPHSPHSWSSHRITMWMHLARCYRTCVSITSGHSCPMKKIMTSSEPHSPHSWSSHRITLWMHLARWYRTRVSNTLGCSCPMTRIMTTSEPHSPHSWSSHRITPWVHLARCYQTHGIAPQEPRVFSPSKTTSGHIYSGCRCSISHLVWNLVPLEIDSSRCLSGILTYSWVNYSPTHESFKNRCNFHIGYLAATWIFSPSNITYGPIPTWSSLSNQYWNIDTMLLSSILS